MKQFNNYLKTQLTIIEAQLKAITEQIEHFPNPQDININKYGKKEDLKKEYKKENKQNIIRKLIGPSLLDLQIYIRRKEINRLKRQRITYEEQINQINNYLESSNETGLYKEITTHNIIFKLILEYASNNNINPTELLQRIINLCRYSKDNNKMEDKIKSNISSFFDENYILIQEINKKTVKMILEKFFFMVLPKAEAEKYNLVIEQLVLELKIDNKEEKESKQKLESKRIALIELQKYINGNKISKTLDIKLFKELLIAACIPEPQQNKLITMMEDKIKKENEQAEQEKFNNTIEYFLTEEERDLLKQAALLERKIEGQLKDLLNRARKDVLSICKYLTIMDQATEFHETTEILADRLRVLKNVVSNIEETKIDDNNLFYITNKEGLPLILRNIELYELLEYQTIYNLLYRVSSNEEGKKLFTIEGINFYYLKQKGIRIIFTETKNKRVVVEIIDRASNSITKKHITPSIIKQIKEISSSIDDKELQNLHATYENIILESLNIKQPAYSLSLKKEED